MKHILLLCPHNAAKSVLAVAYLEKQVREEGLDWQVSSAGTEPDEGIMPSVAEHLETVGLSVSQPKPRLLTSADLETADVIISMGCAIDTSSISTKALIQHWQIPPVSQNLELALEQIKTHLNELVHELKNEVPNS